MLTTKTRETIISLVSKLELLSIKKPSKKVNDFFVQLIKLL